MGGPFPGKMNDSKPYGWGFGQVSLGRSLREDPPAGKVRGSPEEGPVVNLAGAQTVL
jgi:hypothetical protein